MKGLGKLALAVMAMAIGSGARAQENGGKDDAPFYDSSRAQNFIEINAHAGIGLSSVVQNYGSVIGNLSDFFISPGVLMRAGVDVRFGIRNSFGLGTGLDLGINNSRYAMSIVTDGGSSINSVYVNNHYYDATLPVYISFRFNAGHSMTWSVDPGWYFARGLGGHTRLSGYMSGENSLGQPMILHASYEHKYYDCEKPFVNSVRIFDHGPRLALSLMVKRHVTFAAVGQISASNLATNRTSLPVKYRHATLCFQFGYTF